MLQRSGLCEVVYESQTEVRGQDEVTELGTRVQIKVPCALIDETKSHIPIESWTLATK